MCLALLATACTGHPGSAPARPPAPDSSSVASTPNPGGVPTALRRYYAQHIAWSGCSAGAPSGFQCARLTVPLDYARPQGSTVSLPLIRLPAGDSRHRIGSLVINPGGPGGSGISYAEAAQRIFSDALLARFDIVGFDPRGIGGSRPAIKCVSDPELDALIHLPPTPFGPAQRGAAGTAVRHLSDACYQRNKDLLPHVGTVDAARDMDVLRAAVGDSKLTYFGASYGTFLGATYAEEFPDHVRALVLDGAVDPAITWMQQNTSQAGGFEQDLGDFAAWCAARSCLPGGSGTAVLHSVEGLLSRVATTPLPAKGDSRTVGPGETLNAIASGLYFPDSGWPALGFAVRQALDGDGSNLLQLNDALLDRDQNGHYSNQTEANIAINCMDRPYPKDVGSYAAAAAQAAGTAPTFGPAIQWGSLPCAFWHVPPTDQPHPIRAVGSPPILVVGTTRDPATPYAWAQGLAHELARADLLTYVGDGHTAYGRGNPCVRADVDAYLIDLRPPAPGTRCG
jgi:pimeloyl-ACP methyl ester carboxylesterase